MKIILMAASLRKDSCNKKLADVIASLLTANNTELQYLPFAECDVPPYSGDVEEHSGLPPNALKFVDMLKNSDGLVLVSPEYNFSTPGILKNFIDWVSRARPMPWAQVPILLLSASPSLIGGNRGLLASQTVLRACEANVFPRMFSLANAYEAFTPDGQLKEAKLYADLAKLTDDFLAYVALFKHK